MTDEPHITDRQEVWVSYLLYDQEYVSQEKAAELAGLQLIEFRDFLRLVGEGPRHYESGGVLWCEDAPAGNDGHFEFASEDPLEAPDECPHCGAEL